MPNGAHRRKRRRRGSGRPQIQRPAPIKRSQITEVGIQWSYMERERWNEQVQDEDLVRDRRYKIVVFGTAFDLATNEAIAAVYGPCCCEREREAYIDDVLSPELNATLDLEVGPLAWRWTAAGGRTLGAA
jgi:hypothetical protein